MNPVDFPQSNSHYGPPADMEESQVATIHAFHHKAVGGSCDGMKQVVVAWQMSADEIELLKANDGVFFISMMGGLAPHYPSLDFESATHPA
jgi:hypothetical protein